MRLGWSLKALSDRNVLLVPPADDGACQGPQDHWRLHLPAAEIHIWHLWPTSRFVFIWGKEVCYRLAIIVPLIPR